MSRVRPSSIALSGAKAGFEKSFATCPPAHVWRACPLASPSRAIARSFGRMVTSNSPETHRRRAGDALDRLQVALECLPEDRQTKTERQRAERAGKAAEAAKAAMTVKLKERERRPSGSTTRELLESIKTSSTLAMAVPFIALPLVPFGSLSLSTVSSLASVSSALSGAFAELSKNYVFSCGFVGWFCAQALKIFTKWYKTGTFDPMAFFDSGGMPSSHSSLCAAMTTAVAIHHGLSSSLFAACTCFTVIVMYDAMGVRRHAGLQAQVLNAVVGDLLEDHPVSGRKLKEVLGHTPRQVMMGGLLGVLIGLVFPH